MQRVGRSGLLLWLLDRLVGADVAKSKTGLGLDRGSRCRSSAGVEACVRQLYVEVVASIKYYCGCGQEGRVCDIIGVLLSIGGNTVLI
ncbi:hypothetical protein V8F33_006893, partial [Rhypophila sp. PSN 637]